jgi:RNA polymerase sigma factor (sigma-70 family)
MTTDDWTLLRRYVEEDSDEAFAQLVARHLGLVYAAALRTLHGDPQLAQDVAQLVFTNLARKAHSLSSKVVLTGWLHRHTWFTAMKVMRREHRRRAREEEAAALQAGESAEAGMWEELCPWLDEALNQLSATDRNALLLRFIENRSLAEVGERLGFGESGSSRRIARALEKLRIRLAKRGITTTAAALTAVLSAHAVQAAPAEVVASLANAALANVADWDSSRVMMRDSHGAWEVCMPPGTGIGQTRRPASLSVDASDNLYVIDGDQSMVMGRLQRRDRQGRWTVLVEAGKEPNRELELHHFITVATAPNGNIYVAGRRDSPTDPARLWMLDLKGRLTTVAASGHELGQVGVVQTLATDSIGRLYVADGENHRVQVRDVNGKWYELPAPSSAEPSESWDSYYLAVDRHGIVYVTDIRRVFCWTPQPQGKTTAPSRQDR